MIRRLNGRGRLVIGFVAGLATAAMVGLLAPRTSWAATPPHRRFAKVGQAISTTAAREAAVVQRQANVESRATCREPGRLGGMLSFAPFRGDAWPEALRLGAEMRHLSRSIDRSWASFWNDAQLEQATGQGAGAEDVWPRVSVQDKADEYLLQLRGHGLKSSDVNVDVVGERVTIRYDHDETIHQATATGFAPAEQQRAVHFSESLQLGRAVQPGRISIDENADGLTIRLPTMQPNHKAS
jgi:HSP20 family molecular chaperone IbpA